MPRPGRMPVEKANDFPKAIKRVLKSMKRWHYIVIASVFLAALGSIISLVAPNRISDIATAIQKGLVPKTEKLSEIMEGAMAGFEDQEYMSGIMPEIMTSTDISDDDKAKFQEVMASMATVSDEEKTSLVSSIPDSIFIKLIQEVNIDGTTISKEDSLNTIKILSSINMDNQEEAIAKFDSLPKSVYNVVKPQMDLTYIKKLAIFLVALYLISALFSFIQHFALSTVSNRFAQTLRKDISIKINKLPLRYFDTHEMGDVLSRVTNDVDAISMHLNNSLAALVSAITLFVGSVIMMFYTNGIMAITAILASVIGFAGMILILAKSQKYFNQKQKELGNLNGHIEEIYSGHNIVKAYNGEETAYKEFNRLNKNLYNCNQKSQFLSGLMPSMMSFIGNFGFVAVCIVGAILVINNVIEFGVIIAFIIYVRLFTSPLTQIAQGMNGLQATAAASERVFEFLDEEEMPNEDDLDKKLALEDAKGNIEFKHVKFGYDKSRTIIKDFSIDVKSGQKIAIVGPTGAGKTTLVNLLMKFYDIDEGDIIIDGISTKELKRENIHRLFTMVLQDTWLFDGTVRDNIKFNRENISDEEIWNALKVVGVDHYVKTLPGGLNAKLDDSESVSNGQKQLLTIARGMIEDAPFLILDEATSNVDTRTEELVQKAMDKLTIGRTSFIIAHRLSTIKNADVILVMREGNIVEQGSHDELIAKNGFYAELYNSQFSKVTE